MNNVKSLKKPLSVILFILIIISLTNSMAYANSAEPPCLTVIVSFPDEDLSLTLILSNGNETDAVLLRNEQKTWESYYRFFYYDSLFGYSKKLLEDAVLIVKSKDRSFECSVPSKTFKQYNNILTLDMKNEKLFEGQAPYRAPSLIALRVLSTLIIEGFIFYLFGYRYKSSWIAFLIVNLLTQGLLNVFISGVNTGSYWLFSYVFFEIIIIIVEAITFASKLKEHAKARAVIYAIIANLFSLIVGGYIIAYLPV